MKYGVFIVDDKPLIRQALTETINWEKLNGIVLGTAENGKKALELIKKLHPELVISDIKMPGMDGLELTECIKAELPETQVIIITGYQEFEYAQRALSLGVNDLVLKPVRNDDMEQKIEKAFRTFEQQKEMKEAVKSVQEARIERQLYNIMTGNEEDVKNCGWRERKYNLLLVRARTRDHEMAKKIYANAVQGFEKYEKQNGWKTYSWMLQQGQVILLLDEREQSAREWKINIKHMIFSLSEGEKEAECCYTVSQICNDISRLPDCLQDVTSIMEHRYFFSDEKILYVEQEKIGTGIEVIKLQKELDHFKKEIEVLSEIEFRKRLQEIIDEILSETSGDEFRVKCIISEFCMNLGKNAGEKWNKGDTNTLLDRIGDLSGKQECAQFLDQFVKEMRRIAQNDNKMKNPVVRDALAYMKEHYAENFSQTELAEKLNVNSSYLSRIFKKETGHNFMEILTEYRIDKAKELLSKSETRVIEVCQQVGYGDYTYFYQVFKKMEGVSPSEYKKGVKKTNIL